MTRDESERLDDLLSRWHDWQQRGRVTRGYNEAALVVGEYVSSSQYDSENGVVDDKLADGRSKIVDGQVQEMLHPWRTAIYVQARNLCTGSIVWNSPRMPADSLELERVIVESRRQLAYRLRREGLL